MAKTRYTYKYNGIICRNSNNLYKYGLVNEFDKVIACSGTENGVLREKRYELKRCNDNIQSCQKRNKTEWVESYTERLAAVEKWHVVELEVIEN